MRLTFLSLANRDLIDRLSGRAPAWVIELVFGLAFTAAAIVARLGIDLFAPTAGPFALIYPSTMIATLFVRWRAGLITLATSFLWAWYYILPPSGSFHFAVPTDGPRAIVNAGVGLTLLGVAEAFRRAGRDASAQRDAEIARRDLVMRELDHRTKNNFAIVASLLELQMRRAASPEAREALAAAASRVHSFAAAHLSLYHDGADASDMAMRDYLQALVQNVTGGLFLEDRVRLKLDIQDIRLPRDQAIAIGLVLNEAVTNCAKHAFGPGGTGEILVSFHADAWAWRLVVADDGRGGVTKPGRGGLGSTIINLFAEKAGGAILREDLSPGARVTLTGPLG